MQQLGALSPPTLILSLPPSLFITALFALFKLLAAESSCRDGGTTSLLEPKTYPSPSTHEAAPPSFVGPLESAAHGFEKETGGVGGGVRQGGGTEEEQMVVR